MPASGSSMKTMGKAQRITFADQEYRTLSAPPLPESRGIPSYGDDVLREFVRLSVNTGVDVFRVFDALNDLRSMETLIRAVNEQNGRVHCTIAHTVSSVHSISGVDRRGLPA
jgi:hypothetical protein